MQNIETVLVMVDGTAQYAIIPPHLLVGGEGKSPSNLRHLVTGGQRPWVEDRVA